MTSTLILAGAVIAVTVLLCVTALRAWRGWLELKRLELERPKLEAEDREVGLRIELAAVRERLKKLEAIASGVEL